MTTTLAILPIGLPHLARAPDRAIGNEAMVLRELVRRAMAADPSVFLSKRHWDLEALWWETASENWDGYGARALDGAAYKHAKAFLSALPITTPDPDVAADPDGEVSFTWYRDPRRVFSVSIGGSGRVSYAGLFGSSTVHGTEFFDDALPEPVEANLARLFPAGA
jgi:hypothetical protein